MIRLRDRITTLPKVIGSPQQPQVKSSLTPSVEFWGMLYGSLTVAPQMKDRHYGRIVNFTSIGGKVSVPHLLPYISAKFAATVFSEGLRAELKRYDITVID